MEEYDVVELNELSNYQKRAVKLVQERKSTSEIAEVLDINRRKVYRLLKGLAGIKKNIPKKYQTEKQYLRFLEDKQVWSQKLSSSFTVTPEGFLLIEEINVEIELDKRQTHLEECKLCGFDDKDCLHEHHIIPTSQGGSDDEENIVVLCANCHAKVHMLILKGFHPEVALEKVSADRISKVKEAMNRDGN